VGDTHTKRFPELSIGNKNYISWIVVRNRSRHMKSAIPDCLFLSFSNTLSKVISSTSRRCLVYSRQPNSSATRVAVSMYFLTDPSWTVRLTVPPHSRHSPESGMRRYFVPQSRHRVVWREKA